MKIDVTSVESSAGRTRVSISSKQNLACADRCDPPPLPGSTHVVELDSDDTLALGEDAAVLDSRTEALSVPARETTRIGGELIRVTAKGTGLAC